MASFTHPLKFNLRLWVCSFYNLSEIREGLKCICCAGLGGHAKSTENYLVLPSLCLPSKSHARNFMFLAFYLECNHLQNDISTVAAHCPQLCVVSPLIHKDPLILFVQPQDYLKRSLIEFCTKFKNPMQQFVTYYDCL